MPFGARWQHISMQEVNLSVQSEEPQETVKASGPASRLSNRKATKRKKKTRRGDGSPQAQAPEPLKKNTLDRQQTGSMRQDGVTINDLNPYDLGRRSR